MCLHVGGSNIWYPAEGRSILQLCGTGDAGFFSGLRDRLGGGEGCKGARSCLEMGVVGQLVPLEALWGRGRVPGGR